MDVIGCSRAMAMVPTTFARCGIMVMIVIMVGLGLRQCKLGRGRTHVTGSGVIMRNGRDDQRRDHEKPYDLLNLLPEHDFKP